MTRLARAADAAVLAAATLYSMHVAATGAANAEAIQVLRDVIAEEMGIPRGNAYDALREALLRRAAENP